MAIAHVRDFGARFGITDLDVFDFRDIDPSDADHAASWQDNVGAPSRIDPVLTIILLGERLGTPLPATFRLKSDIAQRLRREGCDWVHVAGISQPPLQPDQVPLTGVVFEYFDAFLNRADGSQPGPLRVIFKGANDQSGEPNFGNGEFRALLEAAVDTPQRKRQMRKEYDQQLDWLCRFWERLYGQNQYASIFCADQRAFLDQLERCLTAELLSRGDTSRLLSSPNRADALKVELPGPAPYDLERAVYFLGRGPQVAEIARRALQHEAARRLIPVLGESGAGKSSLLRAGLLNDACSPARRRLGWRTSFISLSEKPADQSPLAFLASALAVSAALPELGPLTILQERFDGVSPIELARRLLQAVSLLDLQQSPGLGKPRLLLVVDQLELALDGALLEEADKAEEWQAFLHVLAVFGDAMLDPAAREAFDEPGRALTTRLTCSVALGLPTDRYGALCAMFRPGDHVFHLPRLVDETALREVITGTFAALGLSIEPDAREELCRDAIQLALGTKASILPVLAVTLTALHDEWKQRTKDDQSKVGSAFRPASNPMLPADNASKADITLHDVKNHGKLDQAIARLGELAWDSAEADELGIKVVIQRLPISGPRQRAQSGEITGRDFALARLFRRLVAISGDEAVPDRLMGLPDSELDPVARPLAEALRRHRLLTRHDDGTWWLVHQAVLTGWPRAAAWREAEIQTFRTMWAMEMDQRRWQEDVAAGEPDAERWLWTRKRQVEQALDWMSLRGPEDRPDLTRFAKQGMIAAVGKDTERAGRILRAASFFDDTGWSREILAAAGAAGRAATNELNVETGTSALNNACLRGNTDLVGLLLQHGADPNLVPGGGWSPLAAAAGTGSREVCDILLVAGARIDLANNDGWTALGSAAANGHDTVVAYLISQGADISHANNDGRTALGLAAANGHDGIVRRLVAAGADFGRTANDETTALFAAAANGHDAVVAYLIEEGANVDHATSDGQTALAKSAAGGHRTATAHLLAAGAKIESVDSNGRTPLTAAAQGGHVNLVMTLADAGANINALDNDGSTPLLLAAGADHEEVVEYLLSVGADKERQDKNGLNALMAGARSRNERTVQALLQGGADTSKRSNAGLTALEMAYIQEAEPVVDLLLATGLKRPSGAELESVLKKSIGMNIGLVINARGKVCMVHDTKFKGSPLWVGYHVDKKRLEIIFDSGSTHLVDWEATDEMHDYLLKINKILIIRMWNRKPVEGYDTSFLMLKDGKTID